MKDRDLSKAIGQALRHAPWLFELELDQGGWADVELLLRALRSAGGEWGELSVNDLQRVVATGSKRRYEIVGTRIRALYGHSVATRFLKERRMPPPRLYHGTSPEVSQLAATEGIKPMGRQYVHLSTDVATAKEVGRRKSSRPTILEIDAQTAHLAGVPFYLGNDVVWLADFVEPRFIRVLGN